MIDVYVIKDSNGDAYCCSVVSGQNAWQIAYSRMNQRYYKDVDPYHVNWMRDKGYTVERMKLCDADSVVIDKELAEDAMLAKEVGMVIRDGYDPIDVDFDDL